MTPSEKRDVIYGAASLALMIVGAVFAVFVLRVLMP